MIRYRVRFFDMCSATPDRPILTTVQNYPEYRAYVPGIPVRIECEELPPEDLAPAVAAEPELAAAA